MYRLSEDTSVNESNDDDSSYEQGYWSADQQPNDMEKDKNSNV